VIDTHAHLDALEDPAGALARACAAGVTRVVTVGTGIDSCRSALALAEAHEGVHAALGIDPHQAGTAEAARVHELRELLGHSKAAAVGETGLDYHYGADRAAEQLLLFEEQLALATERDLPVVIHARAADADTAARLRSHEGTVVMHCFSEPGLLEPALEHGWYVSFAGNVTYPKAQSLRAAAAAVEPTRLLVETDAPYLAPQPVRGRPNEPAYVVHTLAALAELRGVDADELGAQVDVNASAAFGLP
jgi:TatD DNase family protein